uniref:Robl_LC7 domain-containing protein n=2 Tax=Macrostomum lignano TaxID=282301 RepID=A0A1I8J380_9PLAT
MDSLRRFLESYLSQVDGLSAILLSDRDGVGLMSAAQPECQWAVEAVVKRGLVPGFCQAAEQAGKLGVGPASAFVTNYGQMTIVLLSCQPLVVTLIGQPDCNIGAMTGLLKDRAFSEQLRRLQQVLPQESGDAAGGSGPVRV